MNVNSIKNRVYEKQAVTPDFLVKSPIFTERSEVNLIIEIHEYVLALGIAVGLALGIFTIP